MDDESRGQGSHTDRIGTRSITMLVSGTLTLGLLLLMLLTPVPYAVQGAGPTFDALGEVSDTELITISGAETYPTSGELRLTTVTTAGGPGFPVDAGSVVRGWLDPGRRVLPVEGVIDPDVTEEEQDRIASQQMISSQENATVAALSSLGYDVPAELTMVGADPTMGAHGVVEGGDVISGISSGGTYYEVPTYQALADVLDQTPASSTVTLEVDRDGERTDLEIVTTDDGTGASVLGIYLDAEFEYPVDVQIQIDNVGGPSAGTMFALGIVDRLTEGELTGGHVVAGTGTISLDGTVGPIGGITLKMYAAERDGAEFFLAPAGNCAEAVDAVPDGLQVVRVSTLAEARDAVEAIADGDTADLPSC
ncbi:YlbL family protein [Ruania alba]|uniref:endopeptidase La n=1 Tax=Ruania alba TaxID=648782 RepID=A0A1H5CWC8_9MICO|nr:S16 family serine protease [Ruania alba]SED70937.1 PDZ domain-containing protein [Ruania alba]